MLLTQLTKKNRYSIEALIIGLFVYLKAIGFITLNTPVSILLGLIIICAMVYWVHYPNINSKNVFWALILPTNLFIGAILSLNAFPNLGNVFKFMVVGIYVVLFYLALLVDNVLLVLADREEVFPLYRVATTWGQILMIILAIPLFAGVFKLSYNFLIQSMLVGGSGFLFSIYQVWGLRFDTRAKKVKTGEMVLLSLLVAFMIISTTIAVSFFPTESFLRALFEALVLMIGLIVTSSHIKNEITNKLLLEYAAIFLIFFLILVAFKP